MADEIATNPRRATRGAAAQAGTVEAPVEEAVVMDEVEKVVGQDVIDAITRASNGLTGQAVGDGSLDGAAQAVLAAGGGQFIDPSLSQYKENLVLYFDPEHSIVKEVEVGRNGNNTAYCVTVPAGMAQPDNSVIFNKAFNAYVSTFRKEIRVHDENGEPVLDAKNNPVVIGGDTNQVWNEMRSYGSISQMLGAMSGRKFKCVKVLRNFGPSNYVGAEGERRPTGHRLTSLPLFEEI
jgi:hypothetical protein